MTAFLYLQKSGQLLGKTVTAFYGSFVHDDTYTIILGDADRGTLDNFMSSTAPPSTGEDITRLWEGLLRLHEALHAIHNMSAPYSEEVKQHTMLRGWHQNITPKSITVVTGQTASEYDCEFRLGDLGVAEEEQCDGKYAPPELSQDALAQGVNMQMADVWALGCVCSEFAVWSALGLSGLKDYRADREDECRDLGIKEIGAFHDGKDLLQSVKAWHDNAIDSKYADDRIVEPVLQQVVDEMLCEDGDARPSARQLKMKINRIVTRAREQYLVDLARNDSAASSNTAFSSLGLSARNRLSYRTSVRSDTSVESDLSSGVDKSRGLGRSATSRSNMSQRDSFASPPIIDEEKETFFDPPRDSQATSPVSPIDVRGYSKPATYQNIQHPDVQELDSGDIVVPTPLRLSVRSATFDQSVLNGDDKEIVVTRGPPPSQLKRADPPPAPVQTLILPTMGTKNEGSVSEYPTVTEHAGPAVATIPQIEIRSDTGSNDLVTKQPKISDVPQIEIRPDNDPRGPLEVPKPLAEAPKIEIRPDNDPGDVTRPSIRIQESPEVEIRPDVDLKRSLSTPSGLPPGQGERKSSIDLRRSLTSPSVPKQPEATDSSAGMQRPTTASSATVYKPYLDLIEGLIWLNQKKGSASDATLRDEHYLNVLADRDFIFLIDDSGSMRAHREMTSRAVRLLSWLLKKYDKNGMSIYFMQKAEKTHARAGHSSDLQKPLLKILDSCKGRSNVTARLTQIVQEYRDRNAAGSGAQPRKTSRGSFASIGGGSKNVVGAKKIMIFVLTDAAWEAGTEEKVQQNLNALGATLRLQGAPEKAVGIQFIYAEPKPEIATRLKKLKGGNYADR